MPQSLSYLQPLFVEEQSAGKWLGWVSTGFIFYGALVALAMLLIELFLRHRLPPSVQYVILGGTVFSTIACLVPSQVHSLTVLEPNELNLRLMIGPIRVWRRVVSVAQIQMVELVQKKGQRSALQFTGHETQFMTQATCLRITIRDSKRVLVIGSTRAKELAGLLKGAMGAE